MYSTKSPRNIKNPIPRTSKDKGPADRVSISENLLTHFLCAFPAQPEEETDVQTDTDCCGHRSCKADFS
mgnify:CR=1 FL=1